MDCRSAREKRHDCPRAGGGRSRRPRRDRRRGYRQSPLRGTGPETRRDLSLPPPNSARHHARGALPLRDPDRCRRSRPGRTGSCDRRVRSEGNSCHRPRPLRRAVLMGTGFDCRSALFRVRTEGHTRPVRDRSVGGDTPRPVRSLFRRSGREGPERAPRGCRPRGGARRGGVGGLSRAACRSPCARSGG